MLCPGGEGSLGLQNREPGPRACLSRGLLEKKLGKCQQLLIDRGMCQPESRPHALFLGWPPAGQGASIPALELGDPKGSETAGYLGTISQLMICATLGAKEWGRGRCLIRGTVWWGRALGLGRGGRPHQWDSPGKD